MKSRIVSAWIAWATPERLALYPPHLPLVFLAAWAVSIALGGGLLDARGTIVGSDFLAFYGAGREFLTGRADHLYDFAAQLRVQRAVVAPTPYAAFHPFMNPPFTAPFFALFSLGGYVPGLLLWWTFGLGCLVATAALIRREFSALATLKLPRMLVLAACFLPTLAWFAYGQNSMFTLLLHTAFFVQLRRRRELSAGLMLGLLAYKPQLALVQWLVILVNRRWRAVMAAAAATAALIAAGFLVSPAASLEYVRIAPSLGEVLRLSPSSDLLPELRSANLNYPSWGVNSLFGFSFLLLDSHSPRAADAMALALMLLGAFLVVRFWRGAEWQPGSREWDVSMAATFALGVVVAPHLFLYDFTLLLLPFAIVWGRHRRPAADRPLDGGMLFFWTSALYLVTSVGSYLSFAQLRLCEAAGLPLMAVQVAVPAIVFWSVIVARTGQVHPSPLPAAD